MTTQRGPIHACFAVAIVVFQPCQLPYGDAWFKRKAMLTCRKIPAAGVVRSGKCIAVADTARSSQGSLAYICSTSGISGPSALPTLLVLFVEHRPRDAFEREASTTHGGHVPTRGPAESSERMAPADFAAGSPKPPCGLQKRALRCRICNASVCIVCSDEAAMQAF